MRTGSHLPLPRLSRARIRRLATLLVLLPGAALASSCFGPTDSRDTGSILITIQNEEIGKPGTFRLQRPGKSSIVVTSNTETSNIPVGRYTVVPDPIADDIRIWDAAPNSFPITIAANQLSSTEVAYKLRAGTIRVVITGIPQGGVANLELRGPGEQRIEITSTTTIDQVVVGSWELEAHPSLTLGHTYVPQFKRSTMSIASGDTTVVAVDHSLSTGAIALNYRGLPAGLHGEVRIVGPNFDSITNEPVITNLEPGRYTVTTHTITAENGLPFTPEQTTLLADVTVGTVPAALWVDYEAAADDLVLENAYLVQATQRFDGSVPLVAGRDALLRVFVTNTLPNKLTPPVRARIYHGTELVHTEMIEAGEPSVRMEVVEGIMSSTWNAIIPGHLVQPNMHIMVDVDPGETIEDFDTRNNAWPRDRTPQSVAVNDVPPFRVTLVPVATGSRTGRVNEENKEQYVEMLRQLFPVNAIDVRTRQTFTSARNALGANDRTGWAAIIAELTAVRAAEADVDEYYFGVVNVDYIFGVQGMGVLSGQVAMGWDHDNKSEVAAHEWGHNFGLGHAPCGVNEALEVNYPYPDGNIGVFGWNQLTNTLMFPTAKDIMGYCNNMWISDYVWMQSMMHRQGSSALFASARQATDGLLVWGHIVNGQPVLEPALRVKAPLTPAMPNATHWLQALDGNGRLLAQYPVQPQPIDHHNAAAFAVVIPWSAQLEQHLATLRLRNVRMPLASAEITSRAAQLAAQQQQPMPAPANPEASVHTQGGSRAVLNWNSSEYPLALVREAGGGRIVALLRKDAREFITRDARNLEVVFSDGVRSVTRHLGR